MKTVYKFSVVPSLPPRLSRLQELAYNMWWCWNFDAIELFIRLDRDLWEECGHNPVALLGRVSQARLEKLAQDDAYLHSLKRILGRFDTAMQSGRSFKLPNGVQDLLVAYFSLEFGLHESIPIYSGGLGVLAGDHLKSASDIGLPLVGVSLLYREGYFRQYLNPDGWQQETYPDNDVQNMPVIPLYNEHHQPMVIEVELPSRMVKARLWKVQVGRTPLILLDTNLEVNTIEDREITAQLYGGDLEMRLKQEIILGVGGVMALERLGYFPTVFHMNEGHSAFLGLKRIQDLIERQKLTFAEAMEACSAGSVFTTHTPVPAGIDKFPPALMDKYFWKYREAVGISREAFLALGRENPTAVDEPFSVAVLALRLSDRYNGVSQLHGKVSRHMWKTVWPELPEEEIPIIHVTNGIHNKTWTSHELASLFERYLGPRWVEFSEDPEVWRYIDQIPDSELWRTHERRRERLVAFVRRRMRAQLVKRGAQEHELLAADETLDPDILTIGFARRFATYKRATLIFHDVDRLIKLVSDPEQPVQFIFAGKAHPKDTEGKEFIRRIVHHVRRDEFMRRVVFLEDYDMNVARYMLQGVDVWLNNPRRPLEASGTSGMKAAANGVQNLSILDGWWVEGYAPDNGWAIGRGEEYTDLKYQDEVESRTIYDILEKDLVPLFYQRGRDGLPRGWLARMKATFKSLAPVYNTNRMVDEYARKFYLPATERWHVMSNEAFAGARELTDWKKRVEASWKDVHILAALTDVQDEVKVGHTVHITVPVHLGALMPSDVRVQVMFGKVNPDGDLEDPIIQDLTRYVTDPNGKVIYEGDLECKKSGLQGFAVRVLPSHPALSTLHETGLIRWG